ncbi:MAG: hypothetical protein Kow0092_15850 [Deferrisomatales bacterium]
MQATRQLLLGALLGSLLGAPAHAGVEDLAFACGPVSTVSGRYAMDCQAENRGAILREAVLLKATVFDGQGRPVGAPVGGVVDLAPGEVRSFQMVSDEPAAAAAAGGYALQLSEVAAEAIPPMSIYAAKLKRRSLTVVGTGFGDFPEGRDPAYKVFVEKPDGSRHEAPIAYWTDSAIVVLSSVAASGDTVEVNGLYGTARAVVAGASKSRSKRR